MSAIDVSVVIPAYNAEEYLEKAVRSAVMIDVVKELVIVDDGSTDRTWEICCSLKKKYDNVKIHRHPNNDNRGPSATRNLGIAMANHEFIAFLDADDYYLPNRFDAEKSLFAENPRTDGVYGAVQASFLTAKGKKRFERSKMPPLTTIKGGPDPAELLYVLLGDHPTCAGHIHLDALTVRSRIFERCGLFDEDLELGQDTDIIIRMAATGYLVAGSINEPVAMRGVHDRNRVTNQRKKTRSWWFLFSKLLAWGEVNGMSERALAILRRKALTRYPYSHGLFERFGFLLCLAKAHPDLRYDRDAYYRIVLGVFRSRILGSAYIKAEKLFSIISFNQGSRR